MVHLTASALYQTLRCDLAEWVDPETDQLVPPIGSSTKQYAAYLLARDFVRKFQDEQSAEADMAALAKFRTMNNRCKNWELRLETPWDEALFNTLKTVLDNFYHQDGQPIIGSHIQIFANGRTGPGSSLGSIGESFYTKLFSSELTSSSHLLYKLYRDYTKDRELFELAEEARIDKFGPVKVVKGSRLTFAPKERDCSRTICIEASLNTFYQLGLERILREGLRSFFGIDLATQPERNRELARYGSLSDEIVTLDLRSASDLNGYKAMKTILPPGLFSWLEIGRHPSVTLPDGSELELHMLSSMGNGYTFPYETLVFAAVVVSAMIHHGLPVRKACDRVDRLSWGVFGDDIICNREVVGSVRRLLHLLGHEVNEAKSYVEGPFRESCGGDFYKGSPVRAVYCKTLRTPQDRYSLINRLTEWSATTGILLDATISLLLKSVKFRPIPIWDNEDVGLRVPFSLLDKQMRPRKWPKGQRLQGTLGYLRYEPVSAKINLDGGMVEVPPELLEKYGEIILNPTGLMLAFLQGSVRSGSITVRLDRVRYRTKVVTAPNWDVAPVDEQWPTSSDLRRDARTWSNFTRWESVCHLVY